MRRVASMLGVVITVAVAPQTGEGAGLGRFFTTPEVRAALESAQRTGKAVEMDDIEKKKQEKRRRNSYIVIQGVVKRSDGPPTIWANGRNSIQGDEFFSSLNAEGNMNGGTVEFRSRDGGNGVTLLPGQTLSVQKGEVKESYEIKEVPADPVDKIGEKDGGKGDPLKNSNKNNDKKASSGGKGKDKSRQGKSKAMEEADKLEKMLEEANKLKAVSDHYSKTLEGIGK